MRINLKGEKITAGELFSVLFLINFSSLLITTDIDLLSFLSEFILCGILSISAYLLYKKSDVDKLCVKIPVAVLCAFCSVLTFISIIGFKEKAILLKIPVILIIVILFVSVSYCAYLGVQSFSRFAPVCAVIAVGACIIGIISALKNAEMSAVKSVKYSELIPLNLMKCIDAPALFLVLAKNVKNGQGRALSLSYLLSFFSAFIVYFICFLVLKNAVKYYAYPVFNLFQLGEIGSYNKLDMLFISPFLMAVYIKLSALFYGVLRVIK